MKRTRHNPEQIVNKHRDADAMLAAGRTVAQVVQALGVSEATFNRWRNQYGGMKAEVPRRLKELEIENARLKRAVADLTVDNQILKEANNIPGKLDRPHDGGWSLPRCGRRPGNPIDGSVACSVRRDRPSDTTSAVETRRPGL